MTIPQLISRALALVVAAAMGAGAPAALAQQAAASAPPHPAATRAGQAESELPEMELSLSEAVEMALRYNLQVRISSFSPDLQEEAINSARTRFDPTVRFDLPSAFNRSVSQGTNQLAGADVLTSESLSGGFSFNQALEYGTNWSIAWTSSRNATNNTFSTFNPRFTSGLNLTVSQPLLRNFGREVNTQQIISARNNHAVSEEQFRQQVQTIVFQVYQAYWELVFAQRDLDVRRLSLELAQQQLERNRIQVEIGTLAPIETIQAEQQVATRNLSLIQAQVSLRDRQDDLKRLINIEAVSDHGWEVGLALTDEPADAADPIDVAAAIATALDNDPQLRQQRINLSTRELSVRVARNAMLPDISFSGSIQLSGEGGDRVFTSGFGSDQILEIQEGGFSDALRNLLSADFRNWRVGLSVSFPLNNWGAKAQHAQAVINERSILTQIADREQQIRVDVMQAARAVESGAEQVQQARFARDLAQRQLEAEERKFAVGSTTNFQVLEFQRQLADARSSELRSVINFTNALARLEQAKGTLLDYLGFGIAIAGVPGGDGRMD